MCKFTFVVSFQTSSGPSLYDKSTQNFDSNSDLAQSCVFVCFTCTILTFCKTILVSQYAQNIKATEKPKSILWTKAMTQTILGIFYIATCLMHVVTCVLVSSTSLSILVDKNWMRLEQWCVVLPTWWYIWISHNNNSMTCAFENFTQPSTAMHYNWLKTNGYKQHEVN